MTKEGLRKISVMAFIGLGLLLGIYDANKPGPMLVKGSGTGYNGELSVELQVKPKGKEFKIIGLNVTHTDTPPIADPAIETLKNQVLRNQNADLDVVAGATYTSEGVQEAVKNAIEKIGK
ncbi:MULTISPECIES: FMN-binding protein [unclassified Cetobacterium]|uniref:FMN-binding protein n=1 Tax=unclassified Cetobacterium TaxID=2630983 RepID=UPI00064865DE|nr:MULTISPECIES: FMN-binding protein [unclassified Cetobacterium]